MQRESKLETLIYIIIIIIIIIFLIIHRYRNILLKSYEVLRFIQWHTNVVLLRLEWVHELVLGESDLLVIFDAKQDANKQKIS